MLTYFGKLRIKMNNEKLGISFESVYSAPAMLRLSPSKYARRDPEGWLRVRASIALTIDYMKKRVETLTGLPITISLLYNGYTEERYGTYIKQMDNYGFDKIYADSGGLQMVTQNISITEDIKKKVYESQKLADFGFCFDEIPLGIKDGIDPTTARHRSQTSSKLFNQHNFDQCIELTAKNIRSQCEAFEGTKTKSFYILQGNSSEEMWRWFEGGTKVLDKKHYQYIQGLAPADTCLGNGEMESVEMMAACHRLANDFPELVGNQIHFLGVGSPSRLLPIIFLAQGGYLKKGTHVSFDSSTASMSVMMGNMIMPNGVRVKKGVKECLDFMMCYYDNMHDVLAEFTGEVSRNEFYDHYIKHYKSTADLINTAPKHMEVFIRAAMTCIPLWQVEGFFVSAMASMNDPNSYYSALGFLRQVKTEDDMQAWRRQFSRYLRSSKIDRIISNKLEF